MAKYCSINFCPKFLLTKNFNLHAINNNYDYKTITVCFQAKLCKAVLLFVRF